LGLVLSLAQVPFNFDTVCAEAASYDFGVNCAEVEKNKNYETDTSCRRFGKMLLNIPLNYPEMKHFSFFSEKLLYSHKIGVII